MAEILRIGTMVATPLGLLGLLVAAALYAYIKRLQSEQARLNSLPEGERGKASDQYLTRYGLTLDNVTREQKFELVRDEMAKRHHRFQLGLLVCVSAAVLLLLIAALAYVFGPAPQPPAPVGTILSVARTKWSDDKPGVLDVILTNSGDRTALLTRATAKVSSISHLIPNMPSVGALQLDDIYVIRLAYKKAPPYTVTTDMEQEVVANHSERFGLQFKDDIPQHDRTEYVFSMSLELEYNDKKVLNLGTFDFLTPRGGVYESNHLNPVTMNALQFLAKRDSIKYPALDSLLQRIKPTNP